MVKNSQIGHAFEILKRVWDGSIQPVPMNITEPYADCINNLNNFSVNDS